MERRKFLVLAGVGAGMCLLSPAVYFIAPDTKEFAVKLILKEFYYLKIVPGSVERYVDDFIESNGNDLVSRLKWKTTYYLKLSYHQSDRMRDLFRYFILSTDFFINKTDETKEVHYLGMYSPYLNAVTNPYSFIIYPPETIRDV